MKLQLAVLLCCLVFAVSTTKIKWCVSDQEHRKCNDLAARHPAFGCVTRNSYLECIIAIKDGQADAITLPAVDIYTAGLRNYDLAPIIAEKYKSDNDEACTFSAAVVKKNTLFGLNDLRGKKSCHTGMGDSRGWNLPIGTLLSKGLIEWGGADDKPLIQVVSEFFSSVCGVQDSLCKHCNGCPTGYFGDAGAFRCLEDGDVAFMNPTQVPSSQKNNYELLCQDNSREPLHNFKTCNLGREPARAVVSRKDNQLAKYIFENLTAVTDFDLFSSEAYGGKNLMFSDTTARLEQIPQDTDSVLYLGVDYTNKIHSLLKDTSRPTTPTSIRWCAVGHLELHKCDTWSGLSFSGVTKTNSIECVAGATVEECFKKIMRNEADAMAVDGGQVYTAGKCGLVPAMAEQYEEAKCGSEGVSLSSYYSVAVIKKDSGVTWANLKGKKSCHTGMGRTAGWNIPMGLIHKQTNDCDFGKFFSSGCAPGADPSSVFCQQCIGSGKNVGDEAKCKANAGEQYYGYAGAFRCLAEDAGNVAFIKHTIVGENTDGRGPQWANNLKSEDYQLICPGKDSPVPISDYESCNLALVPAHAIVTRPEKRSEVVRVLLEQQDKFGRNGSDSATFGMFKPDIGNTNLLFKDSTQCLQEVHSDNYEYFLGPNYMTAMDSLRKCNAITSGLEKSCTFQTCQ
ncbi:unnamed protein product [Knipowitschia caucasica]